MRLLVSRPIEIVRVFLPSTGLCWEVNPSVLASTDKIHTDIEDRTALLTKENEDLANAIAVCALPTSSLNFFLHLCATALPLHFPKYSYTTIQRISSAEQCPPLLCSG